MTVESVDPQLCEVFREGVRVGTCNVTHLFLECIRDAFQVVSWHRQLLPILQGGNYRYEKADERGQSKQPHSDKRRFFTHPIQRMFSLLGTHGTSAAFTAAPRLRYLLCRLPS